MACYPRSPPPGEVFFVVPSREPFMLKLSSLDFVTGDSRTLPRRLLEETLPKSSWRRPGSVQKKRSICLKSYVVEEDLFWKASLGRVCLINMCIIPVRVEVFSYLCVCVYAYIRRWPLTAWRLQKENTANWNHFHKKDYCQLQNLQQLTLHR